eukprot:scaffold514390_cov28-Prasinocladus_malaysianus.AAC.1
MMTAPIDSRLPFKSRRLNDGYTAYIQQACWMACVFSVSRRDFREANVRLHIKLAATVWYVSTSATDAATHRMRRWDACWADLDGLGVDADLAPRHRLVRLCARVAPKSSRNRNRQASNTPSPLSTVGGQIQHASRRYPKRRSRNKHTLSHGAIKTLIFN